MKDSNVRHHPFASWGYMAQAMMPTRRAVLVRAMRKPCSVPSAHAHHRPPCPELDALDRCELVANPHRPACIPLCLPLPTPALLPCALILTAFTHATW